MASHQIDLPASTVSIPAGAATEAKQDAANALLTSIDSKSNLPVKFNKDGTPTVVNYDTATPSSSEALPVNIVTVNGQSISTTVDLTGAQINVQLSDRGTSPDSVKIGDGVEYLAINANNEATVHDADTLAAIGLLAKLTDTQPVSLASAPLPTDAATATNQSSILTALASLLTELQLKADLSETQPVNIQNASLAVTGTFWQATQPVSIASMPSTPVTGALTDSELRATPVPISGTVTANKNYKAGTLKTAQVAVGLTEVRATTDGSAPSATRNLLKIKPSKNNSGAIFIITAGGSTSTGMEIIGPDTVSFEYDPTDYFLISDTAAQTVEIVEIE